MLPGTVVGADGAMAEIKLANGVVLRGLAGEGIAAGKEAVLVVRPEAIPEIHAANAGGNAIEGTLLDQLFHGDHVRVRIAVAGGQTVQLKLRPQACSGLPAAGGTLRLSIPVEEALILA